MFTEAELRQLLYCAGEELRARAAGKQPGPQPWLLKLLRHLELEVAVSESGHDVELNDRHSEHDERITARQAAIILGLSKRQVQRLAGDLEGEIIDGRWEFSSTAVIEYLKGRDDGRPAA